MLSTVLPALCSVFNLNNKNVYALIARKSSGFTCTQPGVVTIYRIVSKELWLMANVLAG